MTDFKAGQRVHVAFDAVVSSVHAIGNLIEVQREGNLFTNSIQREDVTLAEPANWPPQVGDVWEADGLDWYVRQYRGKLATFTIEPFDQANRPNEHYDDAEIVGRYNVEEFKGLNPTLVRRRNAIVLVMPDDE